MDLQRFVDFALEEDVKDGDHTTLACIPSEARGSMVLIMKEKGVLAGIDLSIRILKLIDTSASVEQLHRDGEVLDVGTIAMKVTGNVQHLLVAERLILNILQRMSGIATKTRSMMDLIAGTSSQILDTRKTTPLFRYFEKEAVRIGGGTNHRQGLYDAMMIKDNHIDFAGGITSAIEQCLAYQKRTGKDMDIIVEARDLSEVKEILAAPPVRRILLDNFTLEMTREAVELIGNTRETESSGGINEDTIRDYALCGVDYISMGALTHQIQSLDLSLKADFHVAEMER
jgi:nicotinate-nucleotide pyrophosphorylase (carboxylating)